MMTRLFFCTDLHGSEICFRKFLNAGSVYGAQTVIMGGDCTGKMLVPLIHDGADTYRCEWSAGTFELNGEEELARQEAAIRNNGLYPVRVEQAEFKALEADPARAQALFQEVMVKTLKEWVALAEERLKDSGLKVIITPGNDDDFIVDDVLRASDVIETPEGTVTRIADSHEMLSIGWSNKTPWETPRECSEEELAEKIRALAQHIIDMDSAIFNIHVPPYGTGLDDAPELEDATHMKAGGSIMKAVGSTAVRDAILDYQPMLSLHGHIHESRGMHHLGRTMCINPGSTYSEMTLQGVIVDIEGDEVERYVPTTG